MTVMTSTMPANKSNWAKKKWLNFTSAVCLRRENYRTQGTSSFRSFCCFLIKLHGLCICSSVVKCTFTQCEITAHHNDSWTSLIWKLYFGPSGIHKSLQELFYCQENIFVHVRIRHAKNTPTTPLLALSGARCGVVCVRRESRSYMQGSIPAAPVIWGSASLTCRFIPRSMQPSRKLKIFR